jgi:hypothetical protein
MKHIVITAAQNPLAGGRAREALRVAAGLAQLSDLTLTVILKHDAPKILQSIAGAMPDHGKLSGYLDTLRSTGTQTYVRTEEPGLTLPDWAKPLTAAGETSLLDQADIVIPF